MDGEGIYFVWKHKFIWWTSDQDQCRELTQKQNPAHLNHLLPLQHNRMFKKLHLKDTSMLQNEMGNVGDKMIYLYVCMEK